jgi:hypothetical protein
VIPAILLSLPALRLASSAPNFPRCAFEVIGVCFLPDFLQAGVVIGLNYYCYYLSPVCFKRKKPAKTLNLTRKD